MKTREQWLADRKSRLGGSDIAAVLGLSRFRSPWDVYMAKTTDIDTDDPNAGHLVRGRYLESGVAHWYADTKNVAIETRDPYDLIIGREPWMAASVDAIVNDSSSNDMRYGLEVKTSRTESGWGESGSDNVPVDYQLQAHWYMIVTGMKRWDFACFFTMSDEFRWFTLRHSQSVEDNIVDRCRKWWTTHIVGKVPPPIDGSASAAEWIRAMFSNPSAPMRGAAQNEIDMARKLESIKIKKRSLDKEEDELKNKIAASIGASEGIRWGDGKTSSTVTYKTVTRRIIDSDRLRAEEPDIADKFTKLSEHRQLRTFIKENI